MTSTSAPTTMPREARFFEWMRSSGGEIAPAVGLTQFQGMGRGVVALQDIEPDTLLFSIPRSILLNIANSRLPPQLPQDDFSALNGWTPLILCMMYESIQADSPWRPYFDLLPGADTFSSLMWWSKEELDELRGSMVLDKIGKDEADAEFETVVKPFVRKHAAVFGNVEAYTLERFHWMGSLILSRSFHVESKDAAAKADGGDDEDDDSDDDDEEEQEDVGDVSMVPMADLLNARFGCDNARLFYEPRSLNMLSTKRIAKGEQIWNTYAEPPNSDLLRRYGHVDEVNGNDVVEVSLKLVADIVGGEATNLDQSQREQRAEFLLDCGVDDTISFETDLELPVELLSSIRTFLLTQADFDKAVKKGSPPKPKLDADVAKWASKVLEKRLSEYPTSIEEDETLLKDAALPERKRMAVVVRLGEKKILSGAVNKVKGQLKSMHDEAKASKKRKGEEKGGKEKRSRK